MQFFPEIINTRNDVFSLQFSDGLTLFPLTNFLLYLLLSSAALVLN